MLKSDLLTCIQKKYPFLSVNDIQLIAELFFKRITIGIEKNQNIELRGFGTLAKKVNKAKFVRNPKTNKKIYKEKNYKIHFKIGKTLHKRINLNLNESK